jgi:hypothetical protein
LLFQSTTSELVKINCGARDKARDKAGDAHNT